MNNTNMYLTTKIRKNEVYFSLKPIKTSLTKTELLKKAKAFAWFGMISYIPLPRKFLFKATNQKQNNIYFNIKKESFL